jgi:hypothetical protein
MSNETTSEEKDRHNFLNVFGPNCIYETVYQLSNRDLVCRIVCFHRILSA